MLIDIRPSQILITRVLTNIRILYSGNLPNKITRDEVLQAVTKKLGNGIITDLRLSLDENKRPRGFGYIELKEENMVEKAIADLNGLDIGERKD